jgi:hypothetical protein
VVEPEKGAGDFLSPMVLTIGAISSMPKVIGFDSNFLDVLHDARMHATHPSPAW